MYVFLFDSCPPSSIKGMKKKTRIRQTLLVSVVKYTVLYSVGFASDESFLPKSRANSRELGRLLDYARTSYDEENRVF